MQLIIHGKNIKILDVIQIHNAVEKNLNHLEVKYAKYIKDDMIAKVDIEKHSNNTFKISAHIQLLNKNYLQCSVEDYDLYNGIRKTLVPLEQQLQRLKTNAKNTGEESVAKDVTSPFYQQQTPIMSDNITQSQLTEQTASVQDNFSLSQEELNNGKFVQNVYSKIPPIQGMPPESLSLANTSKSNTIDIPVTPPVLKVEISQPLHEKIVAKDVTSLTFSIKFWKE